MRRSSRPHANPSYLLTGNALATRFTETEAGTVCCLPCGDFRRRWRRTPPLWRYLRGRGDKARKATNSNARRLDVGPRLIVNVRLAVAGNQLQARLQGHPGRPQAIFAPLPFFLPPPPASYFLLVFFPWLSQLQSAEL